MSDYYVKMEQLNVGYNGKAIIHDINIDINKGEIVTLIGPNGAGKSTILKSITRQLSLISGNVIFDNEDLHRMTYRDLSSKMAVVLTERMHPELMTCHDIVATGRYPYTGRLGVLTREDEDKVDEAMAAVHADDFARQDFNAISDGQRQRVLLARAICQEPDLIILDEPTSFLDVRHKLDLLSILKNMAKKKNITVIMSLHEIDLAMKVSDKIICVKGDHIFKYGSPEHLLREDDIRSLYEIDNGYFDPLFGSIEMPKTEGTPEVMVLSCGGSGIPVYRSLQRQKIPFSAGILYRNDIDYQLARLLAEDVIVQEPFSVITEENLRRAESMMEQCSRVIDAGLVIGETNSGMKRLIIKAEELGKLERR